MFKAGDAVQTTKFGEHSSMLIWRDNCPGSIAFDSVDVESLCMVLSDSQGSMTEVAVMDGTLRRGWVYGEYLRPM